MDQKSVIMLENGQMVAYGKIISGIIVEMITIMTIYTIMVIRCGILRKWEITEAGYGWLWG